MKYCPTCKEDKLESSFSKSATRCKSCDAVARKKYAEKNRAKELARKKKWRDENKDARKEYQRKYQKDNLFRWNQSEAKRKATKLNNGIFEISDKEIINLYNTPCAYCGSTNNISLDHIVPLSRGGSHSIGNLISACMPCNLSKNSKTIMEWRTR